MQPFSLLLLLAFDELPEGDQIPHIQELGSHKDDLISIDSSCSEALYTSKKLHPPVLLRNSIPPVPLRLVKLVEAGLFVEMAELHPSYLDSAELNTGNQPTGGHKRLPEISNIVDWVQCFGIYMAIVSRSKPERIADLIGFQSIIIGASQLGNNDGWILYDRRFRLKASASRTRQWATIDITIWNMAFPDRVIRWHQGQAPNTRSILLTSPSVHFAKPSPLQEGCQSVWTGMIVLMGVHGLTADMNMCVTGVSTTQPSKISTTKLLNVKPLRDKDSRVTDHAPCCHNKPKSLDSFLFFSYNTFIVNYTIV